LRATPGLRRLVPLFLLLLALPACLGVSFSDDFDGTELFKGLTLTGQRVVGEELTLDVTLTHGYPVPVLVGCYYEDSDKLTEDEELLAFHDRAHRAGETVLAPAEIDSPGGVEEEQHLIFRFTVEEPGDYFLACLTPAATDNGYGISFEIEDASPSG
jgi:hypothetical protein